MSSDPNTIECLQCGEYKIGIQTAQRAGTPVPCESEDEWGTELSFKRHKFSWTSADQRAKETQETQDQEKWARLDLQLAAMPRIILGPDKEKP